VRALEQKIPIAKNSRQFARITRVRELILAVVPNVSSHYLKAHGFLGTPGSSATRRILHLTKGFPVFGRISPPETLTLATLACCSVRRVNRTGGLVSETAEKRWAGLHRTR